MPGHALARFRFCHDGLMLRRSVAVKGHDVLRKFSRVNQRRIAQVPSYPDFPGSMSAGPIPGQYHPGKAKARHHRSDGPRLRTKETVIFLAWRQS